MFDAQRGSARVRVQSAEAPPFVGFTFSGDQIPEQRFQVLRLLFPLHQIPKVLIVVLDIRKMP